MYQRHRRTRGHKLPPLAWQIYEKACPWFFFLEQVLDWTTGRHGEAKGREKATLNRPHDVLTHLAEPLPVNCDGEIRQGNKTTRSLPPVSTPVRPLIFTRTSSIRTCVVCASKRPPRKHTEGRSYGNAFGTRFRGTRHFVSRISCGTRLASISTITSLNSHGLV